MASWLILAVTMAAQQVPEFHQGVDYVIEAALDDSTHVLRGRERIKYRNHSKQTIDTLWFHLHLNAFRPNSAWAQREAQFGNRRFQDLGPNDHAYERIRAVKVGTQPISPVFPLAPDSTVMGIPLSTPLTMNASVSITIDWTARLSTLPRRQGRRGSHYDFAQWYPRIAVYNRNGWQVQPLLPQGEFFGEFASYDVTLEVPRNFVIGATGVPMSGDPGWETANIDKAKQPNYNRGAYNSRPPDALGLFTDKTNAGNKRVRWLADDVHHFAWTANPEFRYEGGMAGKTPIHVLFLPSDTNWAGHAVQRTAKAIAFMESVLGPYVYPQITNVHRLEGGGTEFPMVIMDGSADEGLIVHEIAHQWAHGILANNEWRDGWLDEGMASFLSGWYFETTTGRRPNYALATQNVARADTVTGMLPIATPSAQFKDMNHYGAMTYNKPSYVFRMLRDYLGDTDFRAGMKLFYEKNKLTHVDEEDFKNAMEEASKKDLGWFFRQWLHTNHTLDYAVTSATTTQQANGSWRTQVSVARKGGAWMPVRLKVGDVVTTLDSRDATFSVNVDTPGRPESAVLDPDAILLDLDRQNNTGAISN